MNASDSASSGWYPCMPTVGLRPMKLGAITCPTLVITASRDQICPPPAATALLDHIGASDKDVLEVSGGHVGAVVGSKAAKDMYPALSRWLASRL